MILELGKELGNQEIRLNDTLWTPVQAKKLKAAIIAGGAAFNAQGGGISEDLLYDILEALRAVEEAVKAPRSIVETARGMAKSIHGEDPEADAIAMVDRPLS